MIKVDHLGVIVVSYTFDTLKNKIPVSKSIVFKANNINCNFDGVAKKGMKKSFYKIKQKLFYIKDGCFSFNLYNSAR